MNACVSDLHSFEVGHTSRDRTARQCGSSLLINPLPSTVDPYVHDDLFHQRKKRRKTKTRPMMSRRCDMISLSDRGSVPSLGGHCYSIDQHLCIRANEINSHIDNQQRDRTGVDRIQLEHLQIQDNTNPTAKMSHKHEGNECLMCRRNEVSPCWEALFFWQLV